MNTAEEFAAMETAFADHLRAHPEKTRSEVHSAFVAGWRARTKHAEKVAAEDPDAGAVLQIIGDFEAREDRLREYTEGSWVRARELRRRVAALTAQAESRGQVPEDAPLYRRIGEQRRQLREYERIIADLRVATEAAQ